MCVPEDSRILRMFLKSEGENGEWRSVIIDIFLGNCCFFNERRVIGGGAYGPWSPTLWQRPCRKRMFIYFFALLEHFGWLKVTEWLLRSRMRGAIVCHFYATKGIFRILKDVEEKSGYFRLAKHLSKSWHFLFEEFLKLLLMEYQHYNIQLMPVLAGA